MPEPGSDLVPDTWFDRELPILRGVAVAEAAGEADLSRAARTAVPDLSDELYYRSIVALHEAGYLEATILGGWGAPAGARVNGLRERGRRSSGQWPSDDLGEALLEILDQFIAAEDDPTQRSRLAALRDRAADLGVGTLGSALAALAQAGITAL